MLPFTEENEMDLVNGRRGLAANGVVAVVCVGGVSPTDFGLDSDDEDGSGWDSSQS